MAMPDATTSTAHLISPEYSIVNYLLSLRFKYLSYFDLELFAADFKVIGMLEFEILDDGFAFLFFASFFLVIAQYSQLIIWNSRKFAESFNTCLIKI